MEQQIARITHMEAAMNRCQAALEALAQGLEDYDAAREDLPALDDYYESPLWRQDFADDAAGKLPKDLPRGVLSEDGLWNLLTENRRLREALNLPG